MATVIDALVVTLGVDPANFTKGLKQASDALDQAKRTATRSAQQTERETVRALEVQEKAAAKAAKEQEKAAERVAKAQEKAAKDASRAAEKAAKDAARAGDKAAADQIRAQDRLARAQEKAAKDKARADAKDAKDTEDNNKRRAESVGDVSRKLLGLYALFTGGRGVAEFTRFITQADAALGRLGVSLGVAPASVSALGQALERNGGSAAGAAAAYQQLGDAMAGLKLGQGGAILQTLGQLSALSGVAIDINASRDKQLEQIGHALNVGGKRDANLASLLGRQAVGSDFTSWAMSHTREQQAADLADSRKNGPTAESIEASQELIRQFSAAKQASEDLGRQIFVSLSPAIEAVLGGLLKWIDANKKWLADNIGDEVKKFGEYIKSVNWKAIGEDIKLLGGGADSVAQSLGGWHRAVEALFALWIGSKFVAAVANVAKFMGLLGMPIPPWVKAIIALSVGGALASKGSADALQRSNPNQNDVFVDPNTGMAVTVPPGEGNQVQGERDPNGPSLWQRFKGLFHRSSATTGGGSGGGMRSRGGGVHHETYRDTTNYTGSNAEVVRQAAKQLGTTPEDLATVISYETAGTFSPSIHGGKGGNYQGLIQFGPAERRQFGVNDKQTFAQQMPAVVSYLKTRGYKPGMGILDLYSTINAGSPGHYNASDGNGTVRTHVAKMQREHGGNVRRFLGSSDAPASPMPSAGQPSFLKPVPVFPAPNASHGATPSGWKPPSASGAASTHREREPAMSEAWLWNGIPGAAGYSNHLAHMAAASTVHHHGPVDNSSRTASTHIGEMHLHTAATDGAGVMSDLKRRLQKNGVYEQADYGLA